MTKARGGSEGEASPDCRDDETNSVVVELLEVVFPPAAVERGVTEGVASAVVDLDVNIVTVDAVVGLTIMKLSDSVGVALADCRVRESDSDVTVVELGSVTEERGVAEGVASDG